MMLVECVLEKWRPSLAPETKEQLVRNLLFLDVYGLENEMPIEHKDFFNLSMEWDLLMDFPEIVGEPSESLLFFDQVSEKELAGIQY